MIEGTSDFELAMEWYLRYGERGVPESTRKKDYPKGSWFSIAGVANKHNEDDLWCITPEALKLIREHNGADSRG